MDRGCQNRQSLTAAGLRHRYDYLWLLNIHDEYQIASKPNLADQIGQLARQSIIDAGKLLGLRVALDGDYKIGNNWAETH